MCYDSRAWKLCQKQEFLSRFLLPSCLPRLPRLLLHLELPCFCFLGLEHGGDAPLRLVQAGARLRQNRLLLAPRLRQLLPCMKRAKTARAAKTAKTANARRSNKLRRNKQIDQQSQERAPGATTALLQSWHRTSQAAGRISGPKALCQKANLLG